MKKILLIVLLSLIWTFLIIKRAGSEPPPQTYSDQFIVALNAPQTLKFDLGPTEDGYCVSFVQKNGFEAYRGNANEWIKYINSFVPSEGAVVVMNYGEIGHLALFHNGELWEQNFEGRGIVSHRPLDKSHVIGYVLK